jgi:hypothetical protein
MTTAPPAEPLTVLTSALVDDAGLFPPEELDMAAAVARHRRDRAAGSPVLTHRFVCPVARLGELRALLRDGDVVQVIALGPANADTERRLAAIRQEGRLPVVALETRLPADAEEHAAALDVVDSVARSFPGLAAFVEIGTGPDQDQALDLLAGHGHLAKVRCGGVRPELFPAAADLGRFILGAVERGLPFKATAGLHHAVGYRDGATGLAHFGFLNVLLAVAGAQAGLDARQLEDTLGRRDARAVADLAAALDTAAATAVRAEFRSFGSCSTREPLEDLAALGLIPARPDQSKEHPHDDLDQP